MKCQILFSGKNKKNISKCRLPKILPRVLGVNARSYYITYLHISAYDGSDTMVISQM